MARHGGGVPGMASPQQITRTALALARASVTPRRQIMRDYGRSIRDVGGFTDAILASLKGASGQIGSGYTSAIADQTAIDNAARARLEALGGTYGAGSAAAVGGLGDSAASRLIAQKGAATAYGAQLPGVAAARGQLLQSGLVEQRGNALKDRADALRQAFTQAQQQVQSQALAQAVAGANIRNQTAQLGLQRASLMERAREFNASQAQQAAQFQAQLNQQIREWATSAASGAGGKGNPLAGFTPNEISSLANRSSSMLTGTANLAYKLPIQTALRRLEAAGIPRPIALASAMRIYGTLTPPTQADFTNPSNAGKPGYDANGTNWKAFNQAKKAYGSISSGFQRFVSTRQYRAMARKWQKKHPGWVTTPPGYQH